MSCAAEYPSPTATTSKRIFDWPCLSLQLALWWFLCVEVVNLVQGQGARSFRARSSSEQVGFVLYQLSINKALRTLRVLELRVMCKA